MLSPKCTLIPSSSSSSNLVVEMSHIGMVYILSDQFSGMKSGVLAAVVLSGIATQISTDVPSAGACGTTSIANIPGKFHHPLPEPLSISVAIDTQRQCS